MFHKNTFFKKEIGHTLTCRGIYKTDAKAFFWTSLRGLRDGLPDQKLPKYRHCQERGGGSDPCLDFFEGFVHMHCDRIDHSTTFI